MAKADRMGVGSPTRPRKAVAVAHKTRGVARAPGGYILDGGGLDGSGNNGFAGGHIRLDPARKEILVEVDHAATLNHVPGNGTLDQNLRAIMDGAAKVFSNADRGAGIYVYYLFDETDLSLPLNSVNTFQKQDQVLGAHRNATLKSDFLHLLFIDDGCRAASIAGKFPTPAVALTYDEIPIRDWRGTVVGTTDVHEGYSVMNFPKRDELLMCTVAHEIGHLLIARRAGTFNENEHTSHATNPSGIPGDLGAIEDSKSLMAEGGSNLNKELEWVKFFDPVQAELWVKNNQGLAP